jgi:hypothetical protein
MMMPGMPSDVGARQAVAVGGNRAQLQSAVALDRMHEDAVEIVARLLGRDRELGTVDQHLQLCRGQAEGVAEGAGGQIREIRFRQALQREFRPAGGNRHRRPVGIGRQKHFGAVRQLAHDVIEQMRGHRGGSGLFDHGRCRLGDFEIEIGRLHVERRALGLQQHIRQDRNGVAALDHAMHMVQRLEEIGTLEGDTHDLTTAWLGACAWLRGPFKFCLVRLWSGLGHEVARGALDPGEQNGRLCP